MICSGTKREGEATSALLPMTLAFCSGSRKVSDLGGEDHAWNKCDPTGQYRLIAALFCKQAFGHPHRAVENFVLLSPSLSPPHFFNLFPISLFLSFSSTSPSLLLYFPSSFPCPISQQTKMVRSPPPVPYPPQTSIVSLATWTASSTHPPPTSTPPLERC